MFVNSLTLKTLALAASLVSLPAMAHAEEKTFVRDGITYAYTETVTGNRTVIAGTANGKTPFRLVVKDGHVTGEYNYRPTEFSLSEVKSDSAALALR